MKGKCTVPWFVISTMVLLVGSIATGSAWAKDAPSHLYSLQMKFEAPAPGYPVDVTVKIYKDSHHLKGTSATTFDGTNMSAVSSDAVAEITAITASGGNLIVYFTANGYDHSKFAPNSKFEVVIGDTTYVLQMHTSCSQPILIGTAMPGSPAGTFTIEGGDGECLDDGEWDCPEGDKLYMLKGNFRIPTSGPVDLTFTAYKHTSDEKGQSTAAFDGSGLTGIVTDDVCKLIKAKNYGGAFVVDFEVYGWKGHDEFDASCRFQLEISGGITYYIDMHLSCSEDVYLSVPYALSPSGTIIYLDGCGCVEGTPTSVRQTSWGDVKRKFR